MPQIIFRGEGEVMAKEAVRCKITGNPCGTDTWIEGCPCTCENCQRYLLEYQERMSKGFVKIKGLGDEISAGT